MRRTTLRLLLAVLLLVPLHAPELEAGVLRRGTNVELPSFDPQYVIGNSAGAIMYDLFEGLVTRAPDGTIVPAIAASWTISEDGTVYTFELNENAKWSDGRRITAEDFVWSYQRILDPLSGTRGASALFPVLNAWDISLGEKPVDSLGVKAVSPSTLEITLDGPAPYFIHLLASYSNAPVPRHAIEKHGRKWTQPGNMVTNGAYVLSKVVTNTYYQLVKNPHYHGADKVSIEEVFYYPVPSPTTSLKRYLAGELDVILNIPSNQYESLRKDRPEEFRLARGIGLCYLVINNNRPPFDDVRVRKALSLSIDRDVIVEKLLRTGDEPAYSVVPNAIWGSPGEPPGFSGMNQEERWAEARRLLAEAGFDRSNPLRFTFNFAPVEKDRRLAVAYRSMWQRVGVDAELATAGARDLMNRAASRDYEVMRLTYYSIFPDPVSFFALVRGDSFRNYSGYSNADINERLVFADTIRSPEERTAYLREIERQVMADFPVIPTYFQSRAFLVNKRVQGWRNTYTPKMARDLSVREAP
ncbi:MAG: peptide ABC transporter substrate-binding protein [Gammaproteobacteria bacterium]|nr:peptide ABC transporter substrate-binding protein [Gammaproteobacteria bacterium]